MSDAMLRNWITLTAGMVCLGACAPHAQAGDARLLEKFEKQNQAAAQKLKLEVESSLAQAAGLRAATPAKAQQLLRKSLDRLDKDTLLAREEKAALVRRLYDELAGLDDLAAARDKEEKKRKLDWAKTELAKKPPPETVDEPALKPMFAPPFGAASLTVSPVVLAGGRYVRVGVGGTFVTGAGYPFAPGFPPPFFAPGFTAIGINTTAAAPVGGSVVLGGYTSYAASRSEFGVPVLGHIPYLGRLFRNTSSGVSASSFQVGFSARVYVLE